MYKATEQHGVMFDVKGYNVEEFRNVDINGAVGQLYQEMAGRHRTLEKLVTRTG